MQRPVLIKIVGTQTEPGGQEHVLELTTLGTYSCEEGIHQLEYEENDAQEGQPVISSQMKMIFNASQVRLSKKGAAEGVMVFEQGKKFVSMHETPLGPIEMGMLPLQVKSRVEQDCGEVELLYQMDMEQQVISLNRLKISFSPREQAPCS